MSDSHTRGGDAGRKDKRTAAAQPHPDLVAAYRQGLGLAAVAVVDCAGSLRVAAEATGRGEPATEGEAPAVLARWWCRRVLDAQRIAAAVPDNAATPAGEAVLAAARRLRVTLYSDAEIADAAAAVIARVDEEIAQLQRRGDLKSVNKAYREHRLAAAARGEKVARYQDWMRQYKQNLVRQCAETLRQL